MERIDFREAKMDDIIFHNRNKAYGAYVLRADYNKHVRKAMFMGYGFFASILLIPAIQNLLDNKAEIKAAGDVCIFPIPPVIIDQVVEMVNPKPKADMPKPSTGNTNQMTEMNVVENPVERTQDSLPPVAQAAAIDGAPSGGEPDIFRIGGTGTVPAIQEPAPAAIEEVINVADEMPEYVGGPAAMRKFLSENMEYPTKARDIDLEGKVVIGFVVNTDGSVVDAKVLKGIGGGCDQEALRVVKMMPKFKPGRQSGRNVRVRYVLPIAFKLN